MVMFNPICGKFHLLSVIDPIRCLSDTLTAGAELVELDVDGMGCEACQAHVKVKALQTTTLP